jgi:tetratricopeptide (TPR) repeat protein
MAQPTTNPKIEELRFRLKTDPKNRIFYPLAEELRKVGQFSEAEQVLRAGLVHHSTYLSAWVSLGRVLRDQKNDGAAVEVLSTALQLDPGNVVVARLMADAYLALGEKVEAIKKYKLVQALMPGDEEVDSMVERLDAELNPPAAATPPPAEVQPVAEAPVPEAPAETKSPFAPEDSPFAPEPETAPFRTATTEMPFAQPLETASEETPFAPPAEVGEETAAMRPPKPMPKPPFAAAPEPLAPESPFAAASSELTAAHADITEMPFGDAGREAAPEPQSVRATDQAQVFGGAEQLLNREVDVEHRTGNDVPMSAEHAESPFEEPSSYGAAAFEVEAPSRAPLAAGVPVELPATEMPPPEVARMAPEPPLSAAVDESDVFAPAAEPPLEPSRPAAAPQEDITNTLTMADLYARQGLTADAKQIYEAILQRDPQNEVVREKFAALTAPPAAWEPKASPEIGDAVAQTDVFAAQAETPVEGAAAAQKAAKLETWLAKVGKREARRV